jgi:hypothetical protein
MKRISKDYPIICVGDMFDKDKAKKSHYHYRYVCCIGSRSKNSIEKTRWQDS